MSESLRQDRNRWEEMYIRLTRPPVLALLLVGAFAAGALTMAWLRAPAPPLAALSPLPPTPFPPSPTPPHTPTPTSAENGDLLETVYIEIQPQDFAQIVAKREEALQVGILLAGRGDYVPAILRAAGQEIPAQLRLKGDWPDHFGSEKWSFRVHTLGNHAVYGMTLFSLQDPGTRSYLNEWLFLENLRTEDVLAVRYHFVHVVLNGQYTGIYALEEGFSKELFEAQGRREGLILRYDEDLLWEWRYFYDDQVVPPRVERFFLIDEFQSGRIAADPTLSAQRGVAFGLLRAVWSGEQAASEVFDLERMGKFLALCDLWNSEHALIWHNLRYYYNPIAARLEPVVFDAQPLPDYLNPGKVGLQFDLTYDPFYRDPALRRAYVQALEEFSQPGYVDRLEDRFAAQWEMLRAALEPEFGPEVLQPPWDQLRHRQELIRQMLNPLQTTYAYIPSPQPDPNALSVDVGNLLDLPVEVVGLQGEGTLVTAESAWVAPESASRVVAEALPAVVLLPLESDTADLPYVRLRVPGDLLPAGGTTSSSTLSLVTRIWGLTAPHTQTVLADYPMPLAQGPLPQVPTVTQALEQHPYLEPLEGQPFLRIAGGTHQVNGDLILPAGYGLRLEPGTRLLFAEGRFLFATGPLDFQGTSEEPVVLGPLTERWSGVVVLEAGAPSLWSYVTLERTQAPERPGWAITGGVTFYRSPIRLDHCRIVESYAEDGINVIHARFEFLASEFGPAASDAVDADFGQGTIAQCSFHDIAGDAVDVSGSQVEVHQVRMRNIGDKGLSVGEASRLTAQNVHMENVRFGLVSKDLSQATLSDATIVNAWQAGLAAYTKKPAYGPASIRAERITFVDTPPDRQALVQTGSWIDLEGTRIWGNEVDVEALYRSTSP